MFSTPFAMADEAAGMLVANGALGCAVRGFRAVAPALRRIVKLEAYFERLDPGKLWMLRRAMAEAGMLAAGAREPEVSRINDPGWATRWKNSFAPLSIGRRLLVVPPWNHAEESGRLRIVIRPGLAFGTGQHPTTKGAIRAIERLCRARRFKNALDIGTGSGILAIAMARLGVERVLGIEVDRVALANARENGDLNALAQRIRFAATPLARVKGRFELITANILGSVLIALAPRIKRCLTRDGRLVLGGMMERESREVAAHYAPELALIETRIDRGWATMVLAR